MNRISWEVMKVHIISGLYTLLLTSTVSIRQTDMVVCIFEGLSWFFLSPFLSHPSKSSHKKKVYFSFQQSNKNRLAINGRVYPQTHWCLRWNMDQANVCLDGKRLGKSTAMKKNTHTQNPPCLIDSNNWDVLNLNDYHIYLSRAH